MSSECRICCEKIFTPHPKNLFEKRNHRILTAIQQITGLEIVLEEPLPKHICSCCLLDLSHAVAFRQRCLQAHEYLHRNPNRSNDDLAGSDSGIKNELKRELDEDDYENSFTSEDKDEFASPTVSSPVSKKIKQETRMPNSQSPRVRIKRLHVPERRKPATSEKTDRGVRKKRYRPKVYPKDKKYVCDQCGWAFADMSNMKDHKLRHFEKKHVCDECGRKFYTQPLLRLHIRVHHKGEKPYVCKYCGMGFNNSPARCRHERQVHPNELAFKCKICDKRFNSEKSRIKHQDGHKSNQPDVHYCETCNKEFKEASFLHRHFATKYHRKRMNRLAENPGDEGNMTDLDESQGDPEDLNQEDLDDLFEAINDDQYTEDQYTDDFVNADDDENGQILEEEHYEDADYEAAYLEELDD
ncbi:zinc finger protein 431 [Drosophila serrata]|uniref:zinc finger protein 431 n=1 Tax=Drosophila serrata TaxID=7274 RepID=UPI000A1D2653|nr:zinc finger protein 431 [Drosophila serrata]